MRDRSALEQHPELAQLWTLHYAGRVALKSLEYSRSVGPPLYVRPAIEELRRSIADLLVAVERYKTVIGMQSAEVRIIIPENWSPEQADAVFTFLSDVADRVWRAHEAELAQLAMTEAELAAGAHSS